MYTKNTLTATLSQRSTLITDFAVINHNSCTSNSHQQKRLSQIEFVAAACDYNIIIKIHDSQDVEQCGDQDILNMLLIYYKRLFSHLQFDRWRSSGLCVSVRLNLVKEEELASWGMWQIINRPICLVIEQKSIEQATRACVPYRYNRLQWGQNLLQGRRYLLKILEIHDSCCIMEAA